MMFDPILYTLMGFLAGTVFASFFPRAPKSGRQSSRSKDHYAIPEGADPSVDEVAALVPDESLELELLGLYTSMSEASRDVPFWNLAKIGWQEIKTPDGKKWRLTPLWPKGSWVDTEEGPRRKPDAKPDAAILSHRTDNAHKPDRLTRVEFRATYGYDPMNTLNLQLRTFIARKEARVVAKEFHRVAA